MKKYYIYQHSKKSNGEVFYIGRGTFNKDGSKGGYQRAYSTGNRSIIWKETAKEGFDVKIIYESEDFKEIEEKENEFIDECGICINIQRNKIFTNYSINKINSELYTLHVFNNSYLIFKNGDIYNLYGKLIKGSNNGKGYKIITFSDGCDIKKNMYIHRIVAECFVENLNNYPIVNHKDLNRSNNNANNLEWTTQEKNIQYSKNLSSYEFKERRKVVYQFSKNGKFIKEWEMSEFAGKFFGCTGAYIQQGCQQKNIKKGLIVKGYIWIYKEDFEKGNRKKFEHALRKYNAHKQEI